jgi:coenzyme F420-reducing hydrogenase alpha subunit
MRMPQLLQEEETSSRLENLLGSLIKMVGKTNERVDSLDKRINQMEWAMRETHMITQEKGGKSLYTYISPKKN